MYVLSMHAWFTAYALLPMMLSIFRWFFQMYVLLFVMTDDSDDVTK